jgi:hypothetical protein
VITGVAQGRWIDVALGGEDFRYYTTSGQSAESVAAGLASRLAGHTQFHADVYGNVVYTTGPIESLFSNDRGLTINGETYVRLPTLGPGGLSALLALILTAGMVWLRRH